MSFFSKQSSVKLGEIDSSNSKFQNLDFFFNFYEWKKFPSLFFYFTS